MSNARTLRASSSTEFHVLASRSSRYPLHRRSNTTSRCLLRIAARSGLTTDALRGPLVGACLKRFAFLYPALDIIDTPCRAELYQLAQLLAVSSGFAGHPRRRLRIRPWVNELGHRGE